MGNVEKEMWMRHGKKYQFVILENISNFQWDTHVIMPSQKEGKE